MDDVEESDDALVEEGRRSKGGDEDATTAMIGVVDMVEGERDEVRGRGRR